MCRISVSAPTQQSDIHSTRTTAYKNNDDNNTTPIFIGLNKATQKHGRRKKEVAQEKIESDVLKQMCFNVKERKCNNIGIF
jgi:hypothetical protein